MILPFGFFYIVADSQRREVIYYLIPTKMHTKTHKYTHEYIHIDMHDTTVIIIGNELSKPTSDPKQVCLHFTSC